MDIRRAARVEIKDEGTRQGDARTLNFTGAGVTATVTADTATITIAGGGGGGTFGQNTVDFSSGNLASVTISVVDAGVGAGSKIVAAIGGVAAGRDADELEMTPLQVAVAAITAGVGFDLIVASVDEDADGQFLVNWTRD